MRFRTIRMTSLPLSRRSPVRPLVQTVVRSLSMVLRWHVCRRVLRFARFASTQIHFRLNTIDLGMGRIEILTRPGTDRYRGQVSFNFNDDALNARNPFTTSRPPHQSRQYGGNFGGPISKKKASFFLDFEKRDIDDEAVIVATVLDANRNIIVGFQDTVPSSEPSYDVQSPGRLSDQCQQHTGWSLIVTQRPPGPPVSAVFHCPRVNIKTRVLENNVQLTETSIIN